MCHSFESYDLKIAMRGIEARLAAPSPRLAPAGVVAGFGAGLRARLGARLRDLRGRLVGTLPGREALR